jgi:hypothetical protein
MSPGSASRFQRSLAGMTDFTEREASLARFALPRLIR